jgi:ADP-ribosylglycohydrolase
MLTRKELISDSALCVKKSKGCMIGLAVGDALGDLGRDNVMRNRYGIVTDFFTSQSGSTDDTEFALLTAKGLIDCHGKLSEEAVFEAWDTYILAEGGLFDRGGRPLYGAAANLSRGMRPPQSGTDNVMNNDDGAAMRIAPIGIVCAGDPAKAAEMAVIDAQVSHADDGITAAKMVAASVAAAMVNGTTEEIIEAGLQQLKPGTWLERAMNTAMEICDKAECIEDAWADLHTQLWTPTHSVAAEAIPQIYAVYRMVDGDYKKAIFWGTNFGRDADTIGAVLGALCGAKGGIDIIPTEWVERVRYPSGVCLKFAKNEDIVNISEKLADILRQL